MIEIVLGGAAVAALLAFTAAWVLAARPGDPLNRALCAYLMLTAGVMIVFAVYRAGTDHSPSMSMQLARLIAWYDTPQLVLIPFVLDEMFFAKPRTRARRAVLAGVALAVLAMLLAVIARPNLWAYYDASFPSGVAPGVVDYVWAYGNDIVHALAALVGAYVATRPDRTRLQRRQAALVGAGFACLALHSGASFFGNLAFGHGDAYPNLLGLLVIPAIGGILAPFTGSARRALVAALVGATLLGATEGGVQWLADQASLASLELLAQGGRTLVWAEVAVFLAVAVIRCGAAGVTVDARPRLATATGVVFVGSLSVAAFLAALALLGATPVGVGAGIAAAAAPLALPRTPLRALPGKVTDRLLLAPDDPAVRGERARMYAAALRAAAVERGSVPPAGDPALRELRRRLGLGARDHELLASTVDTGADTPAPGTPLLGRYLVERELGRGAYGTALLARDLATGEHVVLKRFHAAALERRALAEAGALAKVRHPRVVPLLAVERVGTDVYLVLSYAEGGTLQDVLHREAQLDPAHALRVALDILDGLEAIHAAGLAHGDVKPGNILIDGAGRALLGDLGSARELVRADVEGTLTSTPVMGSYATMAPELFRGRRASPRADVYSAGAVLYRMLTGQDYVDLGVRDQVGAMEAILHHAPRLPHPAVPAKVAAVIERALAKDPDARFASARAMADELQGLIGT